MLVKKEKKGMNVRTAALKLNINVRMAQDWVVKDTKVPQVYKDQLVVEDQWVDLLF